MAVAGRQSIEHQASKREFEGCKLDELYCLMKVMDMAGNLFRKKIAACLIVQQQITPFSCGIMSESHGFTWIQPLAPRNPP